MNRDREPVGTRAGWIVVAPLVCCALPLIVAGAGALALWALGTGGAFAVAVAGLVVTRRRAPGGRPGSPFTRREDPMPQVSKIGWR